MRPHHQFGLPAVQLGQRFIGLFGVAISWTMTTHAHFLTADQIGNPVLPTLCARETLRLVKVVYPYASAEAR